MGRIDRKSGPLDQCAGPTSRRCLPLPESLPTTNHLACSKPTTLHHTHTINPQQTLLTIMADDADLDALLDDAAEEVMQAATATADEEDLLEAAAADVLGGQQASQQGGRTMLPVPTRRPGAGESSPKAALTLEEALQAVLPPEAAAKWVAVVKADGAGTQEGCGYKPPSYAYRAFTEGGGGRGGSKSKKRPAAGAAAAVGGEDGEEEQEKQEAVGAALPELILRAGAAAGVRDTEGVRAGLKRHEAATERLQRLFVEQMAKDLKPYVEEDGDFDAGRFPATAAKILKG